MKKYRIELLSPQAIRDTGKYIELPTPIANLFYDGAEWNRISFMFGNNEMIWKELRDYKLYLVTDSKTNQVKRKHVLEPNEYWKMIKRVGRNFDVASGAKAAMPFLQEFDLEEYVTWLSKELKSYRTTPRSIEKKLRRDKMVLHLKHLQPLLDHQCKPEWQLLTVLPVVDHPELEEQYQKIEKHCKRMRMFIDGGAPSAVIEDWSLQLQRKIDELMKTLVKQADSDYERLREHAPGIIKRSALTTEIAHLRDIAFGFGLKISEWEDKPDAKLG